LTSILFSSYSDLIFKIILVLVLVHEKTMIYIFVFIYENNPVLN